MPLNQVRPPGLRSVIGGVFALLMMLSQSALAAAVEHTAPLNPPSSAATEPIGWNDALTNYDFGLQANVVITGTTLQSATVRELASIANNNRATEPIGLTASGAAHADACRATEPIALPVENVNDDAMRLRGDRER